MAAGQIMHLSSLKQRVKRLCHLQAPDCPTVQQQVPLKQHCWRPHQLSYQRHALSCVPPDLRVLQCRACKSATAAAECRLTGQHEAVCQERLQEGCRPGDGKDRTGLSSPMQPAARAAAAGRAGWPWRGAVLQHLSALLSAGQPAAERGPPDAQESAAQSCRQTAANLVTALCQSADRSVLVSATQTSDAGTPEAGIASRTALLAH